MDISDLAEYKTPKKRACAVVYRISDRQVGWLYWDDTFVPCVWAPAKREKGEGISFTSVPEFKEN